jgi:hypothetical protein
MDSRAKGLLAVRRLLEDKIGGNPPQTGGLDLNAGAVGGFAVGQAFQPAINLFVNSAG